MRSSETTTVSARVAVLVHPRGRSGDLANHDQVRRSGGARPLPSGDHDSRPGRETGELLSGHKRAVDQVVHGASDVHRLRVDAPFERELIRDSLGSQEAQ